MKELRTARMNAGLRRVIAEFVAREGNRRSLISLSSVEVSPTGREATIWLTVFPTSAEAGALAFLRRRATELRAYIQKHLRIGQAPFLTFAIDAEEKRLQAVGVALARERLKKN